jgi:hypothetical protein
MPSTPFFAPVPVRWISGSSLAGKCPNPVSPWLLLCEYVCLGMFAGVQVPRFQGGGSLVYLELGSRIYPGSVKLLSLVATLTGFTSTSKPTASCSKTSRFGVGAEPVSECDVAASQLGPEGANFKVSTTCQGFLHLCSSRSRRKGLVQTWTGSTESLRTVQSVGVFRCLSTKCFSKLPTPPYRPLRNEGARVGPPQSHRPPAVVNNNIILRTDPDTSAVLIECHARYMWGVKDGLGFPSPALGLGA